MHMTAMLIMMVMTGNDMATIITLFMMVETMMLTTSVEKL